MGAGDNCPFTIGLPAPEFMCIFWLPISYQMGFGIRIIPGSETKLIAVVPKASFSFFCSFFGKQFRTTSTIRIFAKIGSGLRLSLYAFESSTQTPSKLAARCGALPAGRSTSRSGSTQRFAS